VIGPTTNAINSMEQLVDQANSGETDPMTCVHAKNRSKISDRERID